MTEEDCTDAVSLDVQALRTASRYQLAHTCTSLVKHWLRARKAAVKEAQRQLTNAGLAVVGQQERKQRRETYQREAMKLSQHPHFEEPSSLGRFGERTLEQVQDIMEQLCMFIMRHHDNEDYHDASLEPIPQGVSWDREHDSSLHTVCSTRCILGDWCLRCRTVNHGQLEHKGECSWQR